MKQAIPALQQIPEKVYFRIGEVSHLIGVETHVLRYWETEFSLIKPFRGKSKQRLYRRQDVENLLRIKTLLHDEGFTISGARKYLKNLTRATPTEAPQAASASSVLIPSFIKTELQEILQQLEGTKQGTV